MSVDAGRLLVAGALLCSAVGPCAAQTLPDVLQLTYAHSPSIAQERQRLRAARAQVAKAVAGTEPTIAADGEATRGRDVVTGGTPLENSLLRSSVPRSSYDVVVDQPLFRGGRTVAEISGAVATVRAAAFKLSSAEQDALLQVARDYIDVLRDTVDVAKAKKSTDLAAEILKGTQERERKEDASRLDILTAQATLDEATADAESADAKLADSEEQFLRDAGVRPADLRGPAVPMTLPASEEEAATRASDNPDVQYARYAARASREDVRAARSAGRPSVEIEAAIRGREGAVFPEEKERVRSVSLKVHVPIFSGGVVRAEVEAKKALAAGDEDAITEAINEAEAKARSAFRQVRLLEAARQRYHASVAAKQVIVTGQSRLQALSEGSNEDVLSALRSLVEAERAENRAMHDQLVAQLSLTRAVGRMTLSDFGAGGDDPDLTVSARKLILDGISIPFIR